MNVDQWPTTKVIPYDRNPRVISDRAVEQVARSISEYGWQQPLVVDRDAVLIVGHARLLAAKRLGLDQVPVVVADLTPEQARAYRIADNRLNELTSFDDKLLLDELEALAGMDLLTGFEESAVFTDIDLEGTLGGPTQDTLHKLVVRSRDHDLLVRILATIQPMLGVDDSAQLGD